MSAHCIYVTLATVVFGVAVTPASSSGILRMTIDNPAGPIAENQGAGYVVTVCDLSVGFNIGGGCINNARTETRELSSLTVPMAQLPPSIDLNWGVWDSPVSITITNATSSHSTNPVQVEETSAASGTPFTSDLHFLNGSYHFSMIDLFTGPIQEPDAGAFDQSIDANIIQNFTASETGYLFAVGLDVTIGAANQAIDLHVQVQPASGIIGSPASSSLRLSRQVNGLMMEYQAVLDPPLPVTAGAVYTVGLHADTINPVTAAEASVALRSSTGSSEPECQQQWYPDSSGQSPCPVGTQLSLNVYTRSVTACVDECVVESGSFSFFPECSLGCSSHVTGYTDMECAAAGCADVARLGTQYPESGSPTASTREPLCAQQQNMAAVVTGCSFGSSGTSPGCQIASLIGPVLAPQRLEANVSADVVNPLEAVGVSCNYGDPINQGVATLTTSFFCSAGDWHELPAGSTLPDCPQYCNVTAQAGDNSLTNFITSVLPGNPPQASRSYQPPIPGVVPERVAVGYEFTQPCSQPYIGSMGFSCGADGLWSEIKIGQSTANNCTFPTRQPTAATTFPPSSSRPTVAPTNLPTPSPTSPRPSTAPSPQPTVLPTQLATRRLDVVFPGSLFSLTDIDAAAIRTGVEDRVEQIGDLGNDGVRKVVLSSGSIIATVSFRPDVSATQVNDVAIAIARNPISIELASGGSIGSTSPNSDNVDIPAGTSSDSDDDDNSTTLAIIIVLIVLMVVAIGAVVVLQQRRDAAIERKAIPLALQKGNTLSKAPVASTNADLELQFIRGTAAHESQTDYADDEKAPTVALDRVGSSKVDDATRMATAKAINGRLADFYKPNDDHDDDANDLSRAPSLKQAEYLRSDGSASATQLLPTSPGPTSPGVPMLQLDDAANPGLSPSALKLDDQGSIRLTSVRRENPLYAKQADPVVSKAQVVENKPTW